ncbi:HEPN domain-containing protein [Magnetospirillum sp. UT-4]|uniref:HEPN domain-containing protein n=1 Tax=Magnetospirillum sp. UT-4 TaxID=2681467 RepID=UPI00138362A2|nr:HEPN domain-containing protein [Magnetospirillum sp. UT-4]CAA7611537.1 hypothetical protein MTBUT4_100010 [Magnetospirillum sp. UT-4]
MSGIDARRGEAARWFAKAGEDRRSAELLLADDPPLLHPAAFHCQQAGEKLIKGLLVAAGQTIPKSHDLWRLAALAVPLYPQLAADIEAVSDFTPWGTGTRYPDLEADLGIVPQDIRDALDRLKRFHGNAMTVVD